MVPYRREKHHRMGVEILISVNNDVCNEAMVFVLSVGFDQFHRNIKRKLPKKRYNGYYFIPFLIPIYNKIIL